MTHSTFHFLQQAKVAVSDCKTKYFLLQANGLQVFPGENPSLSSTFKYLNYNSRPLGLPPKRMTFQSPHASYSSVFPAHAHDLLRNCRTFQSYPFITIHFVFSLVCPSYDPPGFGSTFTKWSSSLDQSPETTCNQTTSIICWKCI